MVLFAEMLTDYDVGIYNIGVNGLGFQFSWKVVKYLKGFFCLECFSLLNLFTTKIVQS